MYSATCFRVSARLYIDCNANSSFSSVAKNDSDTALSQQSALRLILARGASKNALALAVGHGQAAGFEDRDDPLSKA